MIDEHQGQCIYENGRFRLREETDYAIIDELEDFPPIMVQMEETDDGSESQYADRSSVLLMLNQLADTNPNEQRHYYLKYLLNKRHDDNEELRNEIEWLKKEMTKLDIDHTEEISRLKESNKTLTNLCREYALTIRTLEEKVRSDDINWIREHTVWEQMPTTAKIYTETSLGDDVLTEKRFGVCWECLDDSTEFEDLLEETTFGVSEVIDKLNKLSDENGQLKKELESERQYILYLKSVLEDNEIWYND